MARYIDADALMEELKSLQVTVTGIRVGKGYLSQIVREYQKSVLKIVHEQPTADVVPKSEVERLQNILNSYALQYGTVKDQQSMIDKAKQEVAREIFEEIGKYMDEDDGLSVYMTRTEFYELKEKYTGKEG